jgi:hypothetical protein
MSEHECPDCGSKCAEVAALRAGAIEAEARMYVVIEDNEALRAEIDRMRRERDDAINARSDSLDYARAERACMERDAEIDERRRADAEVERMRPVVEAAERWYTAGLRDGGATANLVAVMRTYLAASSEQECPQHFGCLPERCETCPEREQRASSAGVES